MKLRSLISLENTNEMTLKIEDDVMLENYDVIVIFPIYGRFQATWWLQSGRMFDNS